MIKTKQVGRFRVGRLNARREARKLRVIINNQEKTYFRRLNALFRKYFRTSAFLYEEFGRYEISEGAARLREEFFPMTVTHFRKVFRVIYDTNNKKFKDELKDEIFVLDRSEDFEKLINDYFATRELFLTGVSARLAARIDKVIGDGRADGLNLDQIARKVAADFGFARSRAALVARTETHSAATFANHQYYKTASDDYGLGLVKQWVATNDARTRESHRNANGQERDMAEDFLIDGVPMNYAGDPKGGAKNVVNCRCVIIYKDKE